MANDDIASQDTTYGHIERIEKQGEAGDESRHHQSPHHAKKAGTPNHIDPSGATRHTGTEEGSCHHSFSSHANNDRELGSHLSFPALNVPSVSVNSNARMYGDEMCQGGICHAENKIRMGSGVARALLGLRTLPNADTTPMRLVAENPHAAVSFSTDIPLSKNQYKSKSLQRNHAKIPPGPPQIIQAQGTDALSSRSDLTDMSASTTIRYDYKGLSDNDKLASQVTYVPHSLIPIKRDKINFDWAKSMWSYAHSLSKEFPEENPNDEHLEKYCNVLIGIHQFSSEKVLDRLLEHLVHLCRIHDVIISNVGQPSKQVEYIHGAVLADWNPEKYSKDEYIMKVLTFMKLPLTKDLRWLKLAAEDVLERYKIQFIFDGTKNFVESIAMDSFKNTHNQRLRRGLRRHLGAVWYDRVPEKTLFGSNVETVKTPKQYNLGSYTVRGHLVEVMVSQ